MKQSQEIKEKLLEQVGGLKAENERLGLENTGLRGLKDQLTVEFGKMKSDNQKNYYELASVRSNLEKAEDL